MPAKLCGGSVIRAVRTQSAASDKELVVQVANGQFEALGGLFDQYEPDVRRFIGRLGVSVGDVDDLVQSTFLEVIRAAPRFDAAYPVKNWLLGLAIMMVRRQRRTASRAAASLLRWARLLLTESPPTPAADFERDRELQRFHGAFARLSAKKREVFTLVALEGLSGEEVARTLGIPVATVRTRLHNARLELRASLSEVEP
jgi:RNA polymerase sigma-70 factor, ECF subfamily